MDTNTFGSNTIAMIHIIAYDKQPIDPEHDHIKYHCTFATNVNPNHHYTIHVVATNSHPYSQKMESEEVKNSIKENLESALFGGMMPDQMKLYYSTTNLNVIFPYSYEV